MISVEYVASLLARVTGAERLIEAPVVLARVGEPAHLLAPGGGKSLDSMPTNESDAPERTLPPSP